jgi:hypothetical protein
METWNVSKNQPPHQKARNNPGPTMSLVNYIPLAPRSSLCRGSNLFGWRRGYFGWRPTRWRKKTSNFHTGKFILCYVECVQEPTTSSKSEKQPRTNHESSMNGDETFIVCFYLQYKPQALVAQTYHPLCKRYGIIKTFDS